jgi:hypothetical protein
MREDKKRGGAGLSNLAGNNNDNSIDNWYVLYLDPVSPGTCELSLSNFAGTCLV